jgi:hypothetical protein
MPLAMLGSTSPAFALIPASLKPEENAARLLSGVKGKFYRAVTPNP